MKNRKLKKKAPKHRQVSALPKVQPFRLRIWSDRSFAASLALPTQNQFALVEVNNRRSAHIVAVNGKRWIEITKSPMYLANGMGASLSVLSSSAPGTLKRHLIREYPNGTRRVDLLDLHGNKLLRSSEWKFKNGTTAKAAHKGDQQIVEFRDTKGNLTAVWKIHTKRFAPIYSRTDTHIFDGKGKPVRSVVSVQNGPIRLTTRMQEADSESIQGFSIPGETVTITTDGTTMTAQDNISNPFGNSSLTFSSDAQTGEATGAYNVTYIDITNDTQVTGSGVMTADKTGTTNSATVTVTNLNDGSTLNYTGTNVNGTDTSYSVTASNPDGSSDTSSLQIDGNTATLTTTHTDPDGTQTSETQTFDLSPPPSEPTAGGGDNGGGTNPPSGEGMPSDDGTDERPPMHRGIGDQVLGGAFDDPAFNDLTQFHLGIGGGKTDTGDEGSVDDYASAIQLLLKNYVRGGGTQPGARGSNPTTPTNIPGAPTGWGDSTSDESAPKPALDKMLPGRPLPTANDDWGDLNNPRALIEQLAFIMGQKSLTVASAAIAQTRAT